MYFLYFCILFFNDKKMKQYYYLDGQKQYGPFSKTMLKSLGVTEDTLVWYEGLSDWKNAKDIEDLSDLFQKDPTPPTLPKKSKKKTIIWCSVVLLTLVVLSVVGFIGYDLYEQKQYENIVNKEQFNPKWYLSLDDEEFNGFTLRGNITNISSYTAYKNIQIAFSYYGQNNEVLQTDTYVIAGPVYCGSSISFKVKIRNPKGLKKKLKWEKWSAEIIGAETNN